MADHWEDTGYEHNEKSYYPEKNLSKLLNFLLVIGKGYSPINIYRSSVHCSCDQRHMLLLPWSAFARVQEVYLPCHTQTSA